MRTFSHFPFPVKPGNSCNEAAFDHPLGEDAAYWAGVLLADGNINQRRQRVVLALAEKDAALVEDFRRFLSATNPVCHYERQARLPQGAIVVQRIAVLGVMSPRLVAALARYGVVPRKTHVAQALGGVDRLPRFWAGVIDGDGHVGLYRHNHTFERRQATVGLVGTRKLVGQFISFARTLAPWIRCRPTRDHNSWATAIAGRAAVELVKAFYPPGAVALARKQQAAGEILAWWQRLEAWRREKEARSFCTVPGCGRRKLARGYCAVHWSRWSRNGDPGPAGLFRQPPPPACVEEGCDRKPVGRGLCSLHYQRWQRATGRK